MQPINASSPRKFSKIFIGLHCLALGYNDNLTGTWPTNYITQANKIGILDDVAIVASAAAKRADVVVMLDDTLDSNIVTYDKDTNEFVEKQVGINRSETTTLLDDSFDGSVVKYIRFEKVDQVRDAAAETLTWNVGTEKPGEYIDYDALIIDKDTKVSHNAASIFDLENHQGKVYFVEQNGKYYARFIEVESYTKTTTDTIADKDLTKKTVGTGSSAKEVVAKVTVGKTNYNAAADTVAADVITDGKAKNSNYVLYFNDDDQIYMAVSDQSFPEKAYYVKSIGTSSVKLINSEKTVTRNMKDGDTLIWNGEEFIAPSELKVGDAVMEISEDNLYATVAEATGELTKTNKDDATQAKATIGGKTYVFARDQYIDENYDIAGIEDGDVLGNNVKYILNKDNSIAAILVDETSTGTKLYGIVVDGDLPSKNQMAQSTTTILKNVTIFTSEGKEVTYDLDLDSTKYTDAIKQDLFKADHFMGRMVEYQLNKDGEIKELKTVVPNLTTLTDAKNLVVGADLLGTKGKIEVNNNAYLDADKTITLASNVVIFEVGVDDHNVDVDLVTRASLLAGGNFTPKDVEKVNGAQNRGTSDPYGQGDIAAYAVYVTNSNGAAKALAYTTGDADKLNFAVIDSFDFNNSDGDHNITFKGDDTVYEYVGKKEANGDDGKLAIYTLSGTKVTIEKAYAKKTGAQADAKYVSGWADGLMTFDATITPGFVDGKENKASVEDKNGIYTNIMTDVDTQVYVIDANTGNYNKGSVEDIYKGAYVFVAAIDDDKVAQLVIVDEWTNYNTMNVNNTISEIAKVAESAPVKREVDGTTITITFTDTVFDLADIKTYASLKSYVTFPEGAMTVKGDKISDTTEITNGMKVVVSPKNGGDEITYTINFVPATRKA